MNPVSYHSPVNCGVVCLTVRGRPDGMSRPGVMGYPRGGAAFAQVISLTIYMTTSASEELYLVLLLVCITTSMLLKRVGQPSVVTQDPAMSTHGARLSELHAHNVQYVQYYLP